MPCWSLSIWSFARNCIVCRGQRYTTSHIMAIDERFALHNILFNDESQRLVTAMFRDEFIELFKARDKLKSTLAYNVFFGDGTKIKGPKSKDDKQRATLSFPDIVKETQKTDPQFLEEPDYNDPAHHFSIIIQTLSWHVTESQIATNRVWLMMVSGDTCPDN